MARPKNNTSANGKNRQKDSARRKCDDPAQRPWVRERAAEITTPACAMPIKKSRSTSHVSHTRCAAPTASPPTTPITPTPIRTIAIVVRPPQFTCTGSRMGRAAAAPSDAGRLTLIGFQALIQVAEVCTTPAIHHRYRRIVAQSRGRAHHFFSARLTHQCFDFSALAVRSPHYQSKAIGAEARTIARQRFKRWQSSLEEETAYSAQHAKQNHHLEDDYDVRRDRRDRTSARIDIPFPRRPDRHHQCRNRAGDAAGQHVLAHRTTAPFAPFI